MASPTDVAGLLAWYEADQLTINAPSTLTNFCDNPSFESDTNNWSAARGTIINVGAVLSRITTDNAPVSGAGSACAQVIADTGGLKGINDQPALLSTTTYTFSVWLKSVSGSTAININIGGNTGTTNNLTLTTSWAKYTVTGLGVQNSINIFTATAAAATFLVDAITVTAGTSAPAYFDGNTTGGSWTGTVNDSTSTVPITKLTDGMPVSLWTDQSGNGTNATQATGADQPAVATSAANGLPGVSFNGTSDFLLAAIASTGQPVTIFTVAKLSDTTGSKAFATIAANASGSQEIMFQAGGASIKIFAGSFMGGGSISAGTPFYAAFVANGTSSLVRLNGSQVGSGAIGADTGGTNLFIGSETSVPQTPMHGTICEMVVYTGALAAGDITTVESYLAAKYVSTPSAPSVTSDAAGGISTTAATLNGHVTPNNEYTTYQFNWGTTNGYGNTTTLGNFPAGSNAQAVSATLTGLSQSTTYHYQVVATNTTGTTNGVDQTFTTPGPPSATTGIPTVLQVGVMFNGVVNPQGTDTTVYFQWGPTKSYGNTTAVEDIGSGSLDVNVTADLILSAGVYYYQVVATNALGVSYGLAQAFQVVGPFTTSLLDAVAPWD